MLPTAPIRFTPFDSEKHTARYQARLPHWRQSNVTYFTTIRLGDSLPKEITKEWDREKKLWLKEKGIIARMPIRIEDVPLQYRFAFEIEFNRKLNEKLDAGMGECVFRDALIRAIIIDKFEESQAVIGDFVIMPNHIHMLVNEPESESLQKSLKTIKGASAREINLEKTEAGQVVAKGFV